MRPMCLACRCRNAGSPPAQGPYRRGDRNGRRPRRTPRAGHRRPRGRGRRFGRDVGPSVRALVPGHRFYCRGGRCGGESRRRRPGDDHLGSPPPCVAAACRRWATARALSHAGGVTPFAPWLPHQGFDRRDPSRRGIRRWPPGTSVAMETRLPENGPDPALAMTFRLTGNPKTHRRTPGGVVAGLGGCPFAGGYARSWRTARRHTREPGHPAARDLPGAGTPPSQTAPPAATG